MSRQSADATPDTTIQAKRFTRSGYFKPRVLQRQKILKYGMCSVVYRLNIVRYINNRNYYTPEVLAVKPTTDVKQLLRSSQHESMIVINLSHKNSNSVIACYQ